MGMNSVNLMGRLTRDPEMRTTPSGRKVARFTIAVDRLTSEKQTDFIRISCWEKQADLAMDYLFKGDMVGIEGRLQINVKGEGDDRREYAEVSAFRLTFTPSGRDRNDDRRDDRRARDDDYDDDRRGRNSDRRDRDDRSYRNGSQERRNSSSSRNSSSGRRNPPPPPDYDDDDEEDVPF